MKFHILAGLYTLIISLALIFMSLTLEDVKISLVLAALSLLPASIGLMLKKSWAAHITFGIYGLALITCLMFGVLMLLLYIVQSVFNSEYNLIETFIGEGTITLIVIIPIYLAICILFAFPLLLLNTAQAKQTYGLKIKISNKAVETTDSS